MSQFTDLKSVLTHYGITGKGYGSEKIRCPFHDDGTASMVANYESGLWYCHACAFGGSAVDFIMHKEDVNLREARNIYEGVADGSSHPLRRSPSRESSGLLPSGAGHQRSNRRSTPTWLRDK
jgi:DNA primase